jgi:peptidoglycan/LPS O-acetylase OafA/YrhL
MMERLEIRPFFILLLLVILMGSVILVYGNLTPDDPYFRLFYLYLSIIGILFCVGLAQYLARKNILPFIRTFGIYSLPIYLVHMIAGAGTRLVLSNFLHIQNWVILISGSVLIALLSPILLQHLSKKAGFPYFFEIPKKQERGMAEQTVIQSPQTNHP